MTQQGESPLPRANASSRIFVILLALFVGLVFLVGGLFAIGDFVRSVTPAPAVGEPCTAEGALAFAASGSALHCRATYGDPPYRWQSQ